MLPNHVGWKDKINRTAYGLEFRGEVCDGARRLEGRKSVAWGGLWGEALVGTCGEAKEPAG